MGKWRVDMRIGKADKKKTGIILGCALLAVAVMIGVGYYILSGDDFRNAEVFEVSGSAVITRGGSSFEAVEGMNLQAGDTVKVPAGDSYLRLVLDEDKYILLEPGTEITLVLSGNSKSSTTRIELHAGAVISEIQNKLSEGSGYDVITPVSTMAVRGTVFRVSIERRDNGEYYVYTAVFEGLVESRLVMEDGTLSEETMDIPAGKSIAVQGQIGKADVVYEGDIIYEDLPAAVLEYLAQMKEEGKLGDLPVTAGELQRIMEEIERKESEKDTDEEVGISAGAGTGEIYDQGDEEEKEGLEPSATASEAEDERSAITAGNNRTPSRAGKIPTSQGSSEDDSSDVDNDEKDDRDNAGERDNNSPDNHSGETNNDGQRDNDNVDNKSYKVTFINGLTDGELISAEVKQGGLVTAPQPPSAEGYYFAGWYLDKAGTLPFTFDSVITRDTVIYGIYERISYTVYLIYLSGSQDSVSVYAGERLEEISIYREIEGYIFSGWFLDTEYKTAWDFNMAITENITLYGQYNPVAVYHVTFINGINGNPVEIKKVPAGGTVTPPDMPDHGSNKFIGWYKDVSGNEAFDFEAPITEDTVIYGVYGKKQYKVTILYDYEPDNYVEVYVGPGDKLEESLYMRDVSGFIFNGWFLDEQHTVNWDFNTPITEDTVIYASYEVKEE